jgi:hypothetical protein
VPTLSALLGLPTPFSNLGAVIAGVAYSTSPCKAGIGGSCPCDGPSEVEASWRALVANAAQVRLYLERYQASVQRSALPTQGLRDVDALLAAHTAASAGAALCTGPGPTDVACMAHSGRQLRRFLEAALATCRGSWTQFNVPRMILGCLCTVAGVLCLPGVASWCRVGLHTLRNAALSRHASIWTSLQHGPLSWVGCVVVLARLAALTSNSYIVKEEGVLLALTGLGMLVSGCVFSPLPPLPPPPPPPFLVRL